MLFRTVRARWSVTVSVLFFVLMTGAGLAYAALPYAPGQTLDPACHPGDANCTVQVLTASGDLSGSSTRQTVIGLQGNPVASTTPTSSQVLQWNGSAWAPVTLSAGTSTNYWSATSSGIYYNASGSVAVGNTLSVGSVFSMTPNDPTSGSVNTTGEIRMGDAINGGATPLFGCKHTDPTLACYATDTTGDSYNRFWMDLNGKMYWGPGTGATDATLFRSGSGAMQMNADLATFNHVINGANPQVSFPGTTAGLKFVGTRGIWYSNGVGTLYTLIGTTSGGMAQLSGYRSDAPYTTGIALNPDGGGVYVNGGTNILYRCTVAGTLRVGQTTTVSADCGTAVDTGLRVN